MPCTALAAAKVRRLGRRPHLPLLHPARGEIPRRHAAHRARCRVLAQHPQGEGPSDHHAVAARFRRRESRRRRQRRRDASRRKARARRAAVRRRAADLLARLLRDASRSRNRRSTFRSAPAPTRSAASSPAAIIEYERVKDWWGADLPVARGQNNFDIVRFEYYRDRDVGFEGFTAGSYLFREEFTSRTWATRYDFPAVQGRPRQEGRPARRYAVRRAGLVHQYAARRNSPIRGCARRSATRSISNGPTRPSCTGPTSAPSRCSRTPT